MDYFSLIQNYLKMNQDKIIQKNHKLTIETELDEVNLHMTN